MPNDTSTILGPNSRASVSYLRKVALPIVPASRPVEGAGKRPEWMDWNNPELGYGVRRVTPPGKPQVIINTDPKSLDDEGCGTGLRVGMDIGDGTCVVAFDIDCLDPVLSAKIQTEILFELEDATQAKPLVRVGMSPKSLVAFRVPTADLAQIKPDMLRPVVLASGVGEKVEFYVRNKQFVVEGTHPKTKKPYTSSHDVLVPDIALPLHSGKKYSFILGLIRQKFTAKKPVSAPASLTDLTKEFKSTASSAEMIAISDILTGDNMHEGFKSFTMLKAQHGMPRAELEVLVLDLFDRCPRPDKDRLGTLDDKASELNRMINGAYKKYEIRPDVVIAKHMADTARPAKDTFDDWDMSLDAELDDPFVDPVDFGEMDDVFPPPVVASGAKRPSAVKLIMQSPDFGIPASSVPPRRWLTSSKTLLRGNMMSLTAPGGFAKSTFVLNTLAALMLDTKTYDDEIVGLVPPKDIKVLYLCADDEEAEVQRRVLAWGIRHGVGTSGLTGRLNVISVDKGLGGFALKDAKWMDELERLVKENKLDAVIIDPFANISGMINENDAAEMNSVMNLFRGICARNDCAGQIVHHERKSGTDGDGGSGADKSRGSSAMPNAMRGSVGLADMGPADYMEAGIVPPPASVLALKLDKMLVTNKANYSLRGKRFFRLVSVNLGNGGQGTGQKSEEVGVLTWLPARAAVTAFSGAVAQKVLDVILAAEKRKEHLSLGSTSAEMNVVKVLSGGAQVGFTGEHRIDADAVPEVLARLEREGFIRTVDVKRADTAGGRARRGCLTVVNPIYSSAPEDFGAENFPDADPFETPEK